MNMLLRWGRFNVVGAMGMVVQLGSLALINRLAPGHYLVATAAAVELAVLYNFVWHVRFTWGDRRGGPGPATRLARFHAANGLVSIAGNLLLMRLLVQDAHLPVLAANCVAIACCSIANFFLGHHWAFAARADGSHARQMLRHS